MAARIVAPAVVLGLVLLTPVAFSSGCASNSDAMARELAQLRQQLARLETQRAPAAPESISPDRPPRAPATAEPALPAGPRTAKAPDPAAPPPLPVVKLKPINHDPFADGREPTIRVGKRLAPPVARARRKSGGYDTLNRHGDMVDPDDGKIVYRPKAAGDAEQPERGDRPDRVYEVYEDSHEAPSMKVDRFLKAPNVERPAGTDQGLRKLPRKRLKEFVIRDKPLPFERDDAIVVQHRAQAPDDQEEMAEPVAARQEAAPISRAEHLRRARAAKRAARREEIQAVREARKKAKQERRRVARAANAAKAQKPQVRYSGAREKRVQASYEAAMKLFNASQTAKAVVMLSRLASRYATHELADNALYWVGEAAYAEGDWIKALSHFQDVVIRYPTGNKVPDAMLKSALCYARLGDTSYAMKLLRDVQSLYPKSRVAKLAHSKRLALDGGN